MSNYTCNSVVFNGITHSYSILNNGFVSFCQVYTVVFSNTLSVDVPFWSDTENFYVPESEVEEIAMEEWQAKVSKEWYYGIK